MKHVLAILLLAAFLLPFAGRYSSIQYQVHKTKKKVKWQMIAGLDSSELVVFKFSKEDTRTRLNWKHSKEFELEGEWYDIVYTDTLANDSLQYWLFWDHEETKLNHQLADLVANALGMDPATKNKNSHFNHFTKDLYCIQLGDGLKPLTAYNPIRFQIARDILNRAHAPSSPPPEFG